MDFEGNEKIRNFINKLKEKFKPYKIILFGSRARGDYLEESDYDLIIVSDYFRGMPFLKRMKEVYELYDLDVNVDIIPLTKEEYKERKDEISIVGKGIREGIVII